MCRKQKTMSYPCHKSVPELATKVGSVWFKSALLVQVLILSFFSQKSIWTERSTLQTRSLGQSCGRCRALSGQGARVVLETEGQLFAFQVWLTLILAAYSTAVMMRPSLPWGREAADKYTDFVQVLTARKLCGEITNLGLRTQTDDVAALPCFTHF